MMKVLRAAKVIKVVIWANILISKMIIEIQPIKLVEVNRLNSTPRLPEYPSMAWAAEWETNRF